MHVMRLRSPWQKLNHRTQTMERVALPDASDDGDDHAVYRRRFNQPTGLKPDDVVWMVVQQWSGAIESITINGTVVPPTETQPQCKLDITSALERHNEIEIALVAEGENPPRLIGPVELWIE